MKSDEICIFDSRFVTSGTEKASVVVQPTTVRFAKAQQIQPLGGTIGPIGALPNLPAVGGIEGVAVVEAVGPSVKNLKKGDWYEYSRPIEANHHSLHIHPFFSS